MPPRTSHSLLVRRHPLPTMQQASLVLSLVRMLLRLQLTLLLLRVVATVGELDSRAAATNPLLTFHLSYTTCAITATNGIAERSHTQQPAPTLPRCTVSVRILRMSPHPTWHAVHNESVSLLAPAPFRYPIPTNQLRCHHQTVLQCSSGHSNEQLPVIPAAGFFHEPNARRPPTDTFVVLDGTNCSLTTSSESTSSVRTYGFCLLSNRLSAPIATLAAPLHPSPNFSYAMVCPMQPTPHKLASVSKHSSPPRLLQQHASGQATSDATSMLRNMLVWLYQHSRSRRTERTTGNQQQANSRARREQSELTTHESQLFRSWLFMLTGTSMVSAAVIVSLIVRLTKRIEMY